MRTFKKTKLALARETLFGLKREVLVNIGGAVAQPGTSILGICPKTLQLWCRP